MMHSNPQAAPFEDCLADLAAAAPELQRHAAQQAARLIAHIGPPPLRILLDGSSRALRPGLIRAGYKVCQTPAAPDRFDMVIAAHDALAHYPTEAALQAALTGYAARLVAGGRLLLATRHYDDLLRRRPAWDKPQVLATDNERCMLFTLWEWGGGGSLYTCRQYLVRDTGAACIVQPHVTTRRAWRRAEINLMLARTGFTGMTYATLNADELLISAVKAPTTD